MQNISPSKHHFESELEAYLAVDNFSRLRAGIVDKGLDEIDVRWFTHETPLGPLLLAARGNALVRVAFAQESFDHVRETLMSQFGFKSLATDRGLEYLRTELDEYFTGTRRCFSVPVDFSLTRAPFRALVQQQLPKIGFGTTWSYSTLATAAGRPSAVRAAASACATNPLPIIVPCHRVVRSDGSIGAYLGGSEAKEWLLRHEKANGELS